MMDNLDGKNHFKQMATNAMKRIRVSLHVVPLSNKGEL